MRVISNAFMSQADVVQRDRWKHGPLELILLDSTSKEIRRPDVRLNVAIVEWNRTYRGGFLRPDEPMEELQKLIPALPKLENPNIFFVPRVNGYTELHAMLASVVPKTLRQRYGLENVKANFWLWPMNQGRPDEEYAHAAEKAFEEYIWTKLAKKNRLKQLHFADDSSLRLLAGDTQLWMNRLYRLAVEWSELFGEAHDDDWDPLEEIEEKFRAEIAPEDQDRYLIQRPLMGGDLWDSDDPVDCEEIVDEMLDGGGVMESLHPVIDALHSHRTHEDFSDRYSWVKEDFERSFYSKRSKVKVSLVETVDDLPVWAAGEPEGYGKVLFRDLMCFFRPKDRHIILALRQGKTITEIARDNGLNGHAAISRRVKEIRAQLREVLQHC